ncbi:MAG: protein kinase domain-containing protein, partial [Microbacterium sp.]
MSPENRVLAGRYRVEDVIGEGGMATVHRGTDEKLGRAVAIKILKREHAGDKVFRHRFRMEAQSASRMAHPSIVRVYDTGEATERVGSRDVTTPFIVMEYVQGTLLSDLVARGPVPSGDAVVYVDGVLEAL